MIEPPHSMRDAAVALARNGFRVFKLKVNLKTPAVVKYFDIATNDPKKVFDMWSAPVTGDSLHNNIGILTGGDFMVVDVDVKDGKQGLDTLDKLIDFRGFSTDTWTARSPTGSLHYFLAQDRETRSTVEELGPGIDTRGWHGYVVGAGSITKDGIYEWHLEPSDDTEMAAAPGWLLDQCAKRDEREAAQVDVLGESDTEANVARAIEYLTKRAPEAVEGSGGNAQTYAVACEVMSYGVSEPETLQLMLAHWNEDKALPPWAPEELEHIVGNAARYKQDPEGVRSAAADFTAVDIEPVKWPHATDMEPFDFETIKPRRWIVQDFLAATFAHALVSPGGMGKTQFIVNLCLAVAADLDSVLGMTVVERTNVWYWNQEDDMDELRRRFGAAMKHHGVTWAQIQGRVKLDSGVEKPMLLVRRTKDGRIAENKIVVDQVIAQIRAGKIGLFVADPLIELHEAEENDNVEMRLVTAVARRIAVEGDCAVMVVAHTRKPSGASSDGFAGDPDTMRGGGAQVNVMRLVHTLFSMSVKDAKQFGVPAERRHLYVRLDTGKSNISLIDGKPKWLKRVSVAMGLGKESVGVLEPAALTARGPEVNLAHIIAEAIGRSLARGEWYSTSDVFDEMTEDEQDSFGKKSNWARNLTKNLEGLGLDTKATTIAHTMTDAGMLGVINRKGNVGFQFLLKPA